ncbi:hypothetical protein CYLTODRAFT_418135 [Cylindrobasidium torrendii FP15055 ss-10]|uniref:Uncharacterized protein n=1 Tax=Cylindrobasidium torrendii FP15055 ss-10 TaxID=1314674 RepID=A0A0D7BNL6_9AGAR|nr:hypothetical protein CYLTODRAFT_418135 [Cylindrobasidium torrendii FP15055 ss-10]
MTSSSPTSTPLKPKVTAHPLSPSPSPPSRGLVDKHDADFEKVLTFIAETEENVALEDRSLIDFDIVFQPTTSPHLSVLVEHRDAEWYLAHNALLKHAYDAEMTVRNQANAASLELRNIELDMQRARIREVVQRRTARAHQLVGLRLRARISMLESMAKMRNFG